MKFDENGNRIKEKAGKTVKEEYMENVLRDAKIVAEYLKVDMPRIVLQNGFGGKCIRRLKTISIGLGDGEYTDIIREIIIHEMLHHKGFDHGRIKGVLFMSHHENDHVSPQIRKHLFKNKQLNAPMEIQIQ